MNIYHLNGMMGAMRLKRGYSNGILLADGNPWWMSLRVGTVQMIHIHRSYMGALEHGVKYLPPLIVYVILVLLAVIGWGSSVSCAWWG